MQFPFSLAVCVFILTNIYVYKYQQTIIDALPLKQRSPKLMKTFIIISYFDDNIGIILSLNAQVKMANTHN